MVKSIDEVLQDIIILIPKRIDHEIQSDEPEVKFIRINSLFSSEYLVTGRGRLYHWGPNHAGDPVVTR